MKKILNKLNDELLMDKYKEGDNMAFEILYHRYSTNVYSYLAKRLFDKTAINDVFQNIFMKFHKSKKNYNLKYPFVNWLYTICRSEFLDYCKLKKFNYTILDENISYNDKNANFLNIDIDQYKALNSKEKDVIKLKYYSNQDYEEISKALRISKSNARKIASRGILKIRNIFAGGSYDK